MNPWIEYHKENHIHHEKANHANDKDDKEANDASVATLIFAFTSRTEFLRLILHIMCQLGQHHKITIALIGRYIAAFVEFTIGGICVISDHTRHRTDAFTSNIIVLARGCC